MPTAVTTDATAAPAAPSHVFFGLSTGVMRCRPNSRPPKYAPEAPNFGTKIARANARVPRRPSGSGPISGSQRSCTTKLARTPTYAATHTVKATRTTEEPGSRYVAISARKPDSTTAAKVPATQAHGE